MTDLCWVRRMKKLWKKQRREIDLRIVASVGFPGVEGCLKVVLRAACTRRHENRKVWIERQEGEKKKSWLVPMWRRSPLTHELIHIFKAAHHTRCHLEWAFLSLLFPWSCQPTYRRPLLSWQQHRWMFELNWESSVLSSSYLLNLLCQVFFVFLRYFRVMKLWMDVIFPFSSILTVCCLKPSAIDSRLVLVSSCASASETESWLFLQKSITVMR